MNSHKVKKMSIIMGQLIQKVLILDRNEKMCYGVTLSQHHIIESLRRKGVLAMREISQEQGLAMSTITRMIDVLVRDQLVQRKSNPNDRRKVWVELTDKGKELAEKLEKCTQQFWAKVMALIPEGQEDAILEHTKILLNILEKMRETCCQRH